MNPEVLTKHIGTERYAKVYGMLVAAAVNGGTPLTYGQIAPKIELPKTGNYMANTLGEILGVIMYVEAKYHKRPPLPALVVKADSGLPGPGFFKLARELELFDSHEFMAMMLEADTPHSRRKAWSFYIDAIRREWCVELRPITVDTTS